MNRLVLASTLTVLFFIVVVGLLLAAFLFFIGGWSIWAVVAFTIVFNALAFLLHPIIQDFLLRWLYKARFYTVDEFEKVAPEIAEIVRRVAQEYRFRPPKIGLIPDRNPTAFTYGIFRSGARIVLTQGILDFLEPDEREAVVAHELGHIVHYDFAIMAFVSTLLTIIYEIYAWSRDLARSSDDDRKGSAAFAVLAIISYIFYIIGYYVLLYLSRVREYYADEFAAQKTSPRSLASALLKVAYGIISTPDDVRARKLLKSTETLGIMGLSTAREGALLAQYLQKYPERLGNVLAWDVYSPWALIAELSSTHPLTGKRILRLMRMAGEEIHVPKVDMKGMYRRFPLDLTVYALPIVLPLGLALFGLFIHPFYALVGLLFGLGGALLVRVLYSWPRGPVEAKSVLELLEDPYASPVRGKRVRFRGTVVGRGVPGFELGEDLAVSDGTVILYVNYESWAGLFGNIAFALRKVKQLLGKSVTVTGWFFRGVVSRLDLDKLEDGMVVKSYPYVPYLLLGVLFLLGGFVALLWAPYLV